VISKVLSRLTRSDLDEYRRTVEAVGDGSTADEVLSICQKWLESKLPDFADIMI